MASNKTALEGKVVLVLGGAGVVGSGAVYQLLRGGATVVVPSRSQARLDNLQAWLTHHLPGEKQRGKLVCIHDDAGTKEGLLRVLERIKGIDDADGVDHVLASLGSWSNAGPLVERSVEEFRREMRDSVETHFVALSTLLPILRDKAGSSYTIITGRCTAHQRLHKRVMCEQP
jgi:3-oxoacyl-[acyl-carrier protein] reductase